MNSKLQRIPLWGILLESFSKSVGSDWSCILFVRDMIGEYSAAFLRHAAIIVNIGERARP